MEFSHKTFLEIRTYIIVQKFRVSKIYIYIYTYIYIKKIKYIL